MAGALTPALSVACMSAVALTWGYLLGMGAFAVLCLKGLLDARTREKRLRRPAYASHVHTDVFSRASYRVRGEDLGDEVAALSYINLYSKWLQGRKEFTIFFLLTLLSAVLLGANCFFSLFEEEDLPLRTRFFLAMPRPPSSSSNAAQSCAGLFEEHVRDISDRYATIASAKGLAPQVQEGVGRLGAIIRQFLNETLSNPQTSPTSGTTTYSGISYVASLGIVAFVSFGLMVFFAIFLFFLKREAKEAKRYLQAQSARSLQRLRAEEDYNEEYSAQIALKFLICVCIYSIVLALVHLAVLCWYDKHLAETTLSAPTSLPTAPGELVACREIWWEKVLLKAKDFILSSTDAAEESPSLREFARGINTTSEAKEAWVKRGVVV